MPNYAQPFGEVGGTIGGTLGGAAGVGGSSILSQLLAPLDYPRQALYNLVRSGGRALSGQGSWDDALAAVPGALGAGLAGGLVASGVGAPAGIALGSLLGGAAQGMGQASGREAFNAPTVSDVTGTDAMLPNLLVGAITDPLTYAGGLGGASKGAEVGEGLGQALGRNLENAAVMRGPRYGGGADTLNALKDQIYAKAIGNPDGGLEYERAMQHVANALDNPAIYGEIPKGGNFAGAGERTLAISHPDNPSHITTISMPSVMEGENFPGTVDPTKPPPPRLDIPEMLQAARSKAFPSSRAGQVPLRVEHVPYLDANASRGTVDDLRQSLIAKDMNPWDFHMRNVGVTDAGTPLVRDANAIVGSQGYTSGEGAFREWNARGDIPTAADIPAGQPNMVQNMLLNLLGSDKSVQEELAARIARGPMGGSAIVSPLSPSPAAQARAWAANREMAMGGSGMTTTEFQPRPQMGMSPPQQVSPLQMSGVPPVDWNAALSDYLRGR